jgi:uncharacterized membrane protein YdbT with pleckstrin-like domain
MFSAYVENPNSHFEGQDPDEHIILLLRSHPITNLPWILWAIVLALMPFILPGVMRAIGLDNPLNLPPGYYAAILVINYLLVWIVIFEGFLNWYFNIYLLTTKRVMDITFSSILLKSVDLAPLENVEEADSTTAGLFGTIFNFGDVAIQTAGAKVAVQMLKVPNPTQVADLILDRANS